MRAKAVEFLMTVLFASLAFGQNSPEQSLNRVFHFSHTEAEQALHEITVVIRSTTDIREASIDPAKRTLALRGTAAQIALAEWLFNELDKPANRQPHAPQGRNSATHDYRMPGGGDDVVRVFYLTHTETVQDLTEIATLVRSMVDIRRVFAYTVPRAVTMRGTPAQIAMAEWLVNELDKPGNRQPLPQQLQTPGTLEYRSPSGSDDVARVFYLTNAETVQELQELTTLIRALTDVRRVFRYAGPRAVTMRATASEIAMAEWLVNELDKPTNRQPLAQQNPALATHEYRTPGSSDDVVRVLYLTPGETAQDLQETVILIRRMAEVRRIFTYTAPRAVVLRGTAHQIALAERLFKERPRLDSSKVVR